MLKNYLVYIKKVASTSHPARQLDDRDCSERVHKCLDLLVIFGIWKRICRCWMRREAQELWKELFHNKFIYRQLGTQGLYV